MTDGPLLLCDLTQSWSPSGGGGISTYLREKRRWVLANTPHRLLQIVPGPADRVTVAGRHIWAEVAADPVRGSPNYRFILRVGAVRRLLAAHRPDAIESLCPWVLPWAAIHHRRRFAHTALVAGYRTDFPTAHVLRVGTKVFGRAIGRGFYRLAQAYAEITYREFDEVYTLSEEARAMLAALGVKRTGVLPLAIDLRTFSPARRDPAYRAELGLPGTGPLLVYAGRIDNENAALVMIGDGKLRAPLQDQARGLPIALPGFEADRTRLARALASADLYVSAMAEETFGMSVLEAQACRAWPRSALRPARCPRACRAPWAGSARSTTGSRWRRTSRRCGPATAARSAAPRARMSSGTSRGTEPFGSCSKRYMRRRWRGPGCGWTGARSSERPVHPAEALVHARRV